MYTCSDFTARCYAERGVALLRQSRLSVCLSVTLRYRDHTCWNSSKIISLLVSLGYSLFADQNITDVLQGEHPEILTGIREGYRKAAFGVQKLSNFRDIIVSLKRGKIGPRLLLSTNSESYTRFRLVPKSTISDDL